jgi:ribonuclease D
VAPRLVASGDDIEKIALQDTPKIPAMKGWRFEVFGKDAQALKDGQISLGLKNKKIHKYKQDA